MNKYHWIAIASFVGFFELLVSGASLDCDCWVNCFLGWNGLFAIILGFGMFVGFINWLINKSEQHKSK